LKRAGSADPVGEMTAGALRGLVCAFFVCRWRLAPKNAISVRHLRTTAGRETPERKWFRKIQVESVSQAICASSGLGGLRRALGRPGLDVRTSN